MNTCKILVAVALAVTLQFTFVAGANYTVGAPGGLWDLKTDYTAWVSNLIFSPGDNLIFSYVASAHDVWEVTKSDYEACTIGTPLKKYSGGNNVIALTEAGSRYFYCSVSGHCNSGMKVEILVVSDSPPDSPPSPTMPNSPPPPVVTPPSPPTPSAPSAAAVKGVGSYLAIALVLGALLMTFV